MEEENEAGEIYDGIRAEFPLSFGKQTKSQTPLELIHNTTKRNFPSLSSSSSSKDWLTSTIKNPKQPRDSKKTHINSYPEEPKNEEKEEIGPPPVVSDEEDLMIGPPRPPGQMSVETDDEDEDEDGDEDEEEEEDLYRIPLSNEIVLKGHTKDSAMLEAPILESEVKFAIDKLGGDSQWTRKVVSAFAIDHSGSRVLSGSYDYTVRMYDFQGMNSKLASFRQLEPSEGHQVRSLSWSPTADRFLCVTGSAQAKIYDRDGLTLGEYVKGDMYIRDLKNTKGHISGLTCGEWHPREKQTILTSSEDGSLRIWDVNDFKSQKQVIKPKLARPGRVPVTTCAWDHEGKRIAGGMGDGSLQVWSLKPGWGSRPDILIEKGHDDDITGLKFSSDGRILLSRSTDCSLKCCPMCMAPQAESGKFALYNMVFATIGDKRQGGTHVLYDPSLSERGALVCVARAPRKKSVDDFEAKPAIHNPHALPLFRDQPSRKRQREKALKDPLKSHKPELPMTGPGFGGRVGSTNGSILTQYLLKQGGMIKETWMDEDPREAILKHADAAAKDPKFIAPAYAETQPEPVFAKSDSEEE
ncbi:hypothetical protein IFM89_023917 [Coptis chinensis]|uniref:Transducin/WD40 repeat-like superfamily protein n=1 Tax=Coptis chinensis TaxID=261450 RepID=A0A835M4Q3_9MAGN|nr:hypothetical protein IFM89_023917 [Coptis chinensis]